MENLEHIKRNMDDLVYNYFIIIRCGGEWVDGNVGIVIIFFGNFY